MKCKLMDYADFDPRPVEGVNCESYASTFDNQAINFQATYGCQDKSGYKMPILQCNPLANIYAVANDHDYLADHPDELFLDAFGVTDKISAAEVEYIQEATVEQAVNKRWLVERTKRMCSPQFGRLCKCTDRTDKFQLAKSLLRSTPINSVPVRHGRKYEPIAMRHYEEMTGNTTTPCGLFVAHTRPYLASSPDIVIDGSTIVEVKCPYTSRDMLISNLTVPYLKVVAGELCLDPHHDYFYQVQGQLFCTGSDHCEFVVFTLKDIKVMRITRDDAFICNMVDKLSEFYRMFFRQSVLDKYFYKNSDKYVFRY